MRNHREGVGTFAIRGQPVPRAHFMKYLFCLFFQQSKCTHCGRILLSSFQVSGKNTVQALLAPGQSESCCSGCCQGSPGSSVESPIVSAGVLCNHKDQTQIFFHLARILKGGQEVSNIQLISARAALSFAC